MRRNLLEGFDNWMKDQFNVDMGDFSQIGNTVLSNVKLQPDNGGEPIEYKTATIFELWSNKDGSVFKLKDLGFNDPNDPGKSNVAIGATSVNAGRTFTLPKSEYEKLVLFPKSPNAAMGGMGGMM